ncbi:MAG: pentapeptide repeat-containing protein [Spirulina sp.]
MANQEQVALLKQGIKVWNAWRDGNPDVEIDLRFADLTAVGLIAAKLSYADLSYADLSYAKLSYANLSEADLSYADLSYADLSYANLSEADLSYAKLRSANLSEANLSEANLSKANLSEADLSEANLSEADLSYADLNASQVLGANFTQATLTGACIADWQIGISTILKDVQCDYIFRTYNYESQQFSGRLPMDPENPFALDEFSQRFQIIASALETIDITFTEGIDWQAFFQSFQELRQRYPQHNIGIQGIEEKDGALIVRLKVETEETGAALEELKGRIETTEKQLYSVQLSLREAEGQLKVYREMMGVVQTLVLRPMGDQNFYAPVGNVAGTNQGQMTAYINQNNEAISQLIATLRSTVQAFPSEQKDDVLMELDDLESDLSKTEKPEPKRIGKRLQRILAAGTAAATLAGGAATFTGDLNEFTQNVLELGEKIGLDRGSIQGNP